MDHFLRRNEQLYCEGVSLQSLATRFGTPTYVYSRATIDRHLKVLKNAMSDIPHLICYAVKANANLAVLDVIAEQGVGFDAVSVGELRRLQHIGADMNQVLASGIGKRDDEIEAALQAGVLYICIESEAELLATANIAKKRGEPAAVSIRVNPDVDAKTHPYISTGLKKNKFGIPIDKARALYIEHRDNPHLNFTGVTCHIGSQLTQLAPLVDAAHRMSALCEDLKGAGLPIKHVGMGGGLGIPYGDETPPSPAVYGRALTDIFKTSGLTLVLEPGRVIVGNAGVLLTRVVRQKMGADKPFTIVDAGMNDLMRPALYQALHEIEVVIHSQGPLSATTIVGPVCESTDTFRDAYALPSHSPGDVLAIRSAGAYGMVLANTYNGRSLPAEVLVDGETAHLVGERAELCELWRNERRLPRQ